MDGEGVRRAGGQDRGRGEYGRMKRRRAAGESRERRRGQHGRGRQAAARGPHLNDDFGVGAGTLKTEEADLEPRERTTDVRHEALADPRHSVERAATAAAVELLLIDLLSGEQDAGQEPQRQRRTEASRVVCARWPMKCYTRTGCHRDNDQLAKR